MGHWVNTIDRILHCHVEKTDGCWIWKGYKKDGYGHAQYDGKLHQAHRLIYESLKGPIPEGLNLDHLCRNPSCVNPDHLEPVTQQENILRGLKGRMRTHCAKGHPYSEYLYLLPGTTTRRCKICKGEAHQRWVEKNRERVRTYLQQWKRARKAAMP